MEEFFYIGMAVDYSELIEFLLRRYGSLEPFKGMGVKEFTDIYKVAKKVEQREQMYLAWVVQLPHMDKEHFTPFQEYFDKCTGANLDNRPAEEILSQVEEIRRKTNGG